jgi:hypothetical protein
LVFGDFNVYGNKSGAFLPVYVKNLAVAPAFVSIIAVAIIILYLPTYLGIYLCKYSQLPRSIIIAVTARLLRA